MKITLSKHTTQDGFTLVEVLVAMALFIAILVIASNAFNKIVSQSSKYSKMEESNIEGIIGLEVMRHDLGQMGFGLPWGFSKASPDATVSPPTTIIDSTISYSEADTTLTNGKLLNDAPAGVPRAFSSMAEVSATANDATYISDYFALKGTTLGGSKIAQRWAYIPYHNISTASGRVSQAVTFSANNLLAGNMVIMVNSNANDITGKDHRLIVDPATNSSFHQSFSVSSMSDNFLPTDNENTYMVYGIGSTAPKMPFNRADFFVKVPGAGSTDGSGSLPPFCAPLTGVLYKATVNQADGKYTFIPLLDCVADMQVVLGWDSSDAGKMGVVDSYSSLPQSDGTVSSVGPSGVGTLIQTWLTSAQGVREHLKVVKVYILAQEGKFDSGYTYKNPDTTRPSNEIRVGPEAGSMDNLGLTPVHAYTLNTTTTQPHFHWKLYRIVVRPKNLLSNQR